MAKRRKVPKDKKTDLPKKYLSGLKGKKRGSRAKLLKNKDLAKASDEMIDSAWHKQTTKRCESLANIMRNANK